MRSAAASEPALGSNGRGRGAVGEQVSLAFLDPVLHVAAGASRPSRRRRALASARLSEVTMKRPFRLGDDPPLARPTVRRRPRELLVAARRHSARLRRAPGRGKLALDHHGEPGVARRAEQIIDPIGFASGHQGLAGEARERSAGSPHAAFNEAAPAMTSVRRHRRSSRFSRTP
jgi:hypothetical protein